jgi:hypothetical protein
LAELEAGDGGTLPVTFSWAVLHKYREEGATLIRTNNVGRILLVGPISFRIDFGIEDERKSITLLLGEFLQWVPRSERATGLLIS